MRVTYQISFISRHFLVLEYDSDDDIDVVLGGGYIPTGMFAHMDLFDDMVETAPPILILKNTLR